MTDDWVREPDDDPPPERIVPRTLIEAIEAGDVPPSRWWTNVEPNPKYL